MKIAIITLFPEAFSYFDLSILKRAKERGLLHVDFVNPRDFTTDRHRTVDDYPYGGGAGMVLKPEPIFKAVDYIREKLQNKGPLIMASPQGEIFTQEVAEKLSHKTELIFLCGHYEGFDERIRTLVDYEFSIGDYVLTGGELPVMVMVDALVRLVPNVITPESVKDESFRENLLDHPHYTRPAIFRGMKVPEVLLSGHHEKIRRWRRKERLKRTLQRRPDLLKKAKLSKEDISLLKEITDLPPHWTDHVP